MDDLEHPREYRSGRFARYGALETPPTGARMDSKHEVESPAVDMPTRARQAWSRPRLERLDFDGTEQSAKNPSSFEGATSYNSPPVT
jgi:hypothetical protein